MAGSSGTTFLLSAADVSWGRRERTCVTVGVAATALDGNYFLIDAPASAGGSVTEFYVWFDLDAVSTDPAPAGKTAIEVDVVTGDLASDVASKLQIALEAQGLLRAKLDSVDNTIVIIDSEYIGKITTAAADVDTTFTFEQNVIGVGGDLGKTSGGVSIAMESTSVQILSDQTGQLPLDEFTTGNTVEVTMSLLEMTPERWETVVGSVTGDTFTPSGGTQLVGYGDSRLYSSLLDLGGELVLHPSRFDASDRTRNITMWKSSPKPASINFSGEEPQVMEITFTGLLNNEVESAINLFAFGDNEQEVRV